MPRVTLKTPLDGGTSIRAFVLQERKRLALSCLLQQQWVHSSSAFSFLFTFTTVATGRRAALCFCNGFFEPTFRLRCGGAADFELRSGRLSDRSTLRVLDCLHRTQYCLCK